MTVPQKKYFCKRIDEITAQKVNELKDVASAGNIVAQTMTIVHYKS